ncbi:ATP-binding protein [Sporosarcina sp. ANT_H38]|uniref:AAA family ATPase n=1 Tax=Sporosarcina sp. ANT_H38 TaxID=2597358 RepID=UPI0011F3AC10|nr:AAA family ATPase [Sporosarcina sp. ANT_H38]KAA0964908.1 ATP-binding protein [Sporosarcina sp. ANT_H38]
MNRYVVITVGKTHSGKSTFAKALGNEMINSVVIDQDNHAEFLQINYQTILPKQGPNTIKYALTQTIVNYAITETNCHLILCNANRNRKGRLKLLEQFHNKGFSSIIVNFDIPEHVLKVRVTKSQRDTSILRIASNFAEVLTRQHNETNKGDVIAPIEDEADHLFVVKDSSEIQMVIREIVEIAKN